MKRILLVIAMLIVASPIALGQKNPRVQDRMTTNDEEALKQLVQEWADAVVHADLAKLGKIMDDNFRGSAAGVSFNKRMLLPAIRSGQMKVAAWTVDVSRVSVKGNTATVTGRSSLSNALYMGQDYSGDYEWTDRFVKQQDGSWRAVSSQATKKQ